MKASVLRIGNIVTHNYFEDKPRRVLCIGNRGVKIDNDSFHFVNYEQLSAVKITSLYLGKLGFKQDVFSLKWGNGSSIYLYKKETSEKYVVQIDSTIIREVEAVHEIQNLYFAITGKEL